MLIRTVGKVAIGVVALACAAGPPLSTERPFRVGPAVDSALAAGVADALLDDQEESANPLPNWIASDSALFRGLRATAVKRGVGVAGPRPSLPICPGDADSAGVRAGRVHGFRLSIKTSVGRSGRVYVWATEMCDRPEFRERSMV
jgi:hypothetical protein